MIPALVLAGWVWRGLRLHMPLRAAILLLLALTLASPSLHRQQDVLDLFVLLDRSESTGDRIDKGLPEWRRLLERSKPGRRDQLRWVNFGAETAEAGVDGSSFTGSRKLTRTNLALATVAAMSDPQRPARVLVFTDGYATEPLDEAAQALQARKIPVDFRLLGDGAGRDYRVVRFDMPPRVQAGEPFVLGIELRGPDSEVAVPVLVRRNDALLAETTATFQDGRAILEFTDRLAQPGGYRYEVEIRPENDPHPGNNLASKWIEATGGPRVLLVSRYTADPLAAALAARDFDVAVIDNPARLNPGLLAGCRAVILNNVPAHELPEDFSKSLDFFVREQGGGLLMAGGERSFGSGGYFESPIDPLLPVSMELKSEHRKLAVALAIVMDRSGSMGVQVGGNLTKMDLANSGAANAIELLGPMDQVTVFAVDSEPSAVVPLTTVGNRRKPIIDRVRRVRSSGGGIFVYTGLHAAWEELRKSPAGTRHVILFTDVEDTEEPGDYKNLIREMTDEGCTLSVIGLGTPQGADAALCEDIAALGQGRMFFSDKPMDIPRIFSQETVSIARSAFLRDPAGTLATGRWAEISPKALEWPGTVDGYNLSYARPDATVSLASADEYAAPLIAHARRGLGRSAAVSFPLGGEYSETIRNWPGYGDFSQTLVRFLMGQDAPQGIALRHRIEGTRLSLDLLYDPELWTQKLALDPPVALLRDDTLGRSLEAPWRRISPGRFSLEIDLEEGSVLRGAVRIDDRALPFGPLQTGPSVEWSFDPARLAELRNLSQQSGGRELLDLSDAWLKPPVVLETSLRPALLIALLLLILLEALIARMGWRLPEWRFPRAAPAAGAMPARGKTPKKPRPSPSRTAVAEAAPPEEIPAAAPSSEADPAAASQARSSRFQRAKERR